MISFAFATAYCPRDTGRVIDRQFWLTTLSTNRGKSGGENGDIRRHNEVDRKDDGTVFCFRFGALLSDDTPRLSIYQST